MVLEVLVVVLAVAAAERSAPASDPCVAQDVARLDADLAQAASTVQAAQVPFGK